jgi:pimeloyl-ACP methyl ester carboxylesterase
MSEQRIEVGDGITLCYEAFGDPSDPPLLLVMGLGMQMIAWDDRFCQAIADRGYHVVRFDNRDAGRSTHTDVPVPTLKQLALRRFDRRQYELGELAGDAANLVKALGLAPAHVVGASMGGMIVQLMAAEHPEVVRTLTSIMSNTGHRWLGQPALAVYPRLLRKPATNREEGIERTVEMFALIGSPGFPRDDDRIRDQARRSIARDGDPRGMARQLGAILASGDRRAKLAGIRVPTLVIHGTQDKMVNPSGGKLTAKLVPDAKLMLVEGMGHDLPEPAWGRINDAIVAQAREADAAAGRSPAASAAA